MPKPPSWRDIERALIEVAKDNEIEIEANAGDSYIEVSGGEGIVSICLADLAKQLEEKL